MASYIREQATLAQAAAEAGQPLTPESVHAVSGGFKSCGSGPCVTFSGFNFDSTGRISGADVNGKPIAGRIAVGSSSTGGGLAISSVYAYALSESENVDVVFVVRNISHHVIGPTTPAFLPVFTTSSGQQYNYAFAHSLIPGPIQPGVSTAVLAEFAGTRVISGQFSLLSNGGSSILVKSDLRALRASAP